MTKKLFSSIDSYSILLIAIWKVQNTFFNTLEPLCKSALNQTQLSGTSENICTSVFTISAQTTKAFALQQDEKERRMSVVKDTALYYYSPELPENCVYWRHVGKGV